MDKINLKKYIKVFMLLLFVPLIVFIYGGNFKLKAGDSSCSDPLSYDANSRCSCLSVNQCRLSKIKYITVPGGFYYDPNNILGPNAVPGGTSTSTIESAPYVCIPAGKKASDYPDYNAESELKRLGYKDFQTPVPYYTDVLAVTLERKYVYADAECRFEDGVAYWYNPKYFNIVGGADVPIPGDICKDPILVSTDLYGNTVTGTPTFFGCLPNSQNGFVAFVVRIAVGIGIVVALLIASINFIGLIWSSTNSEVKAEKRKKMIDGLIALAALIFGPSLLNIIGIHIFNLPNFGGSILTIFVGG